MEMSRMSRMQRAEDFVHVTGTLYYFGGNYPKNFGDLPPGAYSDKKGKVAENAWMRLHPDLLADFRAFMKAFMAEVEQRYEEE